MVKREGFEDFCEFWCYRNVLDEIFMDVYDGNVWKCFNGGKFEFFIL